jgi:hypothetical protein
MQRNRQGGPDVILDAHGLRVELPRGWSGRVFGGPGGVATLHAGDFQLPLQDGEFGDRSTGSMPEVATFLALTEYRPGAGLEPGVGLFSARRIPLPLDPASFGTSRLAHPRPGQVGTQHFFTTSGRPFCMYAVIAGPRSRRRGQLLALDRVLRSVRIAARTGATAPHALGR